MDWREVINRCNQGDPKSQEFLYKQLSDKMFAISLYYSKDYSEAQDILQDAFVKVFNKLDQYSFQGSFEGWVRRIVVNTAIETLRAKKMKFSDVEDQIQIEDHQFPLVTEEIAAGDILKMVQDLSPQYRVVFNMYALEGYTHKEIAQELGISEGTSKSNLSRARGILQRKVSEKKQSFNNYLTQVDEKMKNK